MEFLVGPTIRESDGLAMSSRNAYLTADQRNKATILHRALKVAEARILAGEKNAERVREAMRSVFAEVTEFRLDYGDIVSPESFEQLTEIRGKILLIIAGRIGLVRLIDNLSVSIAP
jgi:pantoate--beta-alanine ligase